MLELGLGGGGSFSNRCFITTWIDCGIRERTLRAWSFTPEEIRARSCFDVEEVVLLLGVCFDGSSSSPSSSLERAASSSRPSQS